mmetsp:Transcript_13547/g.34574  ORF Transcript_13547/g.34574 Transcript_13547/m.34574 type:complete len:265 (-) Transcript_13547:653-1447(-)
MNVVLHLQREVVVDHNLDVLHVKSSCCHISGNHERVLPTLELLHDPVTLLLALVSMNSQCGIATHAQITSKNVGSLLCFTENENAVVHVCINDGEDFRLFLIILADLNYLSNLLVGCQALLGAADRNSDRVVQVVCGECLDFFWPRGAPHESLSVGTNLVDDLTKLWLKTHVEHSICFVQNKISDTAKVCSTRLQHVDQATRGGNDDFNTTGEVTNLGPLRHTTINGRVLNARCSSKPRAFLLNLLCKLTSRKEDEHDGPIASL